MILKTSRIPIFRQFIKFFLCYLPSLDEENCHSPCHGLENPTEVHVDVELGFSAGNKLKSSIIYLSWNEVLITVSESSTDKATVGKLLLTSFLGACFIGFLVLIWCKFRQGGSKNIQKEEEPMVGAQDVEK